VERKPPLLNNPITSYFFETVSGRAGEETVVDGWCLRRWGCRFDRLFMFCSSFGFFGLWGFSFLACVHHGLGFENRFVKVRV